MSYFVFAWSAVCYLNVSFSRLMAWVKEERARLSAIVYT